jgi:regulatory protein
MQKSEFAIEHGLFAEDTEFEKAKNSVLKMLSFANRSSIYLYDKLSEKGFDDDVATRAIARLRESGLINDESFASEIVRNALYFKKANRAGILRELKKHKIPVELQEATLNEVTDEEIESAIDDFIEQKLRSASKPGVDEQKVMQKVYMQAMRKYGYVSDLYERICALAHSNVYT